MLQDRLTVSETKDLLSRLTRTRFGKGGSRSLTLSGRAARNLVRSSCPEGKIASIILADTARPNNALDGGVGGLIREVCIE